MAHLHLGFLLQQMGPHGGLRAVFGYRLVNGLCLYEEKYVRRTQQSNPKVGNGGYK
jgi:hypothetical protein